MNHVGYNATGARSDEPLLYGDCTWKRRSAPQSKNAVSTNMKQSRYIHLMANFSRQSTFIGQNLFWFLHQHIIHLEKNTTSMCNYFLQLTMKR